MAGTKSFESTTREQLEAVASPRRLDIVDRLAAYGPLSVSELALHVGSRPSALYHHIERLMAVGLVVEAGSRVRRRKREQLYNTPAPRMRLRRAFVDNLHPDVMADIVAAQTRQMSRDFEAGQQSPVRIPEGPRRNHTYFRLVGRPSEAQLARLNACLAEMIEILWDSNEAGADLVAVGLVMAPLAAAAAPSPATRGRAK